MSYNPFDPKDLWDITKIQNWSNPLSPFYMNRNNKSATKIKDLIPRKPKKEYIRTEQDDKEDNFVLIVCIIGYVGALLLYKFVLKKYLQ